MDPTAAGKMADLESEYQKRKVLYDRLVATNDSSNANAILNAKKAMSDTLDKMLELSAQTGTESQQKTLIYRIMEIQRDYNGLLVATDDLETLRRIERVTEAREGTEMKLYGAAFLIAAFGLLVIVTRTS
jgi:hypothetical protein